MKSCKLEIVDISYDGAGVAKSNGKAIFVPKTVPGEVVQAEIVREHSKFCVGRLIKILQPSAQRQTPFCPHFDVCGGCDFQNVDAKCEKALKTSILQKELSKVGFCGEIGFVPSASRKHYRNKLKLEVCNGKVGYYKAGTHDFFEISTCPIASQRLLNALEEVKDFLNCFGKSNFQTPSILNNLFCNLKSVCLKEAENGVGIGFLFDKKCLDLFLKNKIKFEEFLQNDKKTQKNAKILRFFDKFLVFFAFGEVLESNNTQIFSFVQGKIFETKSINKISQNEFPQKEHSQNEFSQNKFFQKEFSKKRLVKTFGGIAFETEIDAFNQVNDDVAAKLYNFVVQQIDGQNVVNAYSGQGLLTALLAQKARKVFGIEYQKSAHLAAEKLCERAKQNFCGHNFEHDDEVDARVDEVDARVDEVDVSADASVDKADARADKVVANVASADVRADKVDVSADLRVENICGKVEEELPKLLQHQKIDAIVLDPAREGCKSAVLHAILGGKIPKVIYISCNFSTLTRDLKTLLFADQVISANLAKSNLDKNDSNIGNASLGKDNTGNANLNKDNLDKINLGKVNLGEIKQFYKIKTVQIFDMFPCTANMETVVVLEREP